LALAAVAGWLAVLSIGVLWGVFVSWTGDLGCESAPGSSNYGALQWSVVPPGPTCVFTEEVNGFAHVDEPTPVMSVWLVVLVLGTFVCLTLIRRARRP
jgi:hypothetical protein